MEIHSTDQSAPTLLQPALTAGTPDRSPNGEFCYQAVRSPNGTLTDLRLTMVNAVAERDLGHLTVELLSHSFAGTFPNLDQTNLLDRYRQVVETGQSARFEWQSVPPGQPTIWFEISVVRLNDGIVVSYKDISQIKADINQQAQLLQGVLEGVPTGIIVLNAVRSPGGPDHRITDFRVARINSVLQRAISPSVSDVAGQLLTTVFHNADESGLLSRCIMGVDLAETQEFETPYSTNGAMGWYRVSMAPKDDQLILAFADITKIRQAQLVQHDQAELLNSVLDGSQNAIVAFNAVRDSAGRIVDFRYVLQNEVNRQRVGRTDAQLIGHTLLEFFPDVATNGLLDHYINTVKTGEPVRQDIVCDYGSGLGWYNISVVKRNDGIVLTVQDINAGKLAEERVKAYQRQLEAANEELLRSNDNLQSFAYVASHDLQEPLRKIQSFGDILKNQHTAQLGEGVKYIERIQAAATRMSLLIKDLLTFSRISTRPETNKAVSLSAVMQAALSDLDLVVAETGATVTIESLPTIHGDRSQLGQLFQNLLSNALKFRQTDASPVVRVSAGDVAAPDLPSSVKPTRIAATYHRVDVTDNGIGFDEKYVDRIFQVFQRLHGRNEFAGTGIGLAICEKVAANHGGTVTATSRPGQGATFSVYFPVEDARPHD